MHYTEDKPLQSALPGSVYLAGVNELSGWMLEAAVDQNGSFEFPGVAEGNYVLRAGIGSGTFILAISESGQRTVGDLIELGSEANEIRFNVALGSTHSTVDGILSPDTIVMGKGGVVVSTLRNGIDILRAFGRELSAYSFHPLFPVAFVCGSAPVCPV